MPQPWVEFAGNKRMMWIAHEWENYADRLAEWAMERLVNRRDVWSQYTLKNGEVGVVMLPIKERRNTGTDMVTIKKLRRHFSGRAVSHLIGLHSISDHSTAKWFAVDVDLHDENIANSDEVALSNFAAVMEWASRLRAQGMDPLLFDSNGVGGYHLYVLLDREYPLADVYAYADQLRSNWAPLGLPRKPEIFPPKPAVKPDDLPYALRVPGRHHTRPHYSRVWNFEGIGETDWLEGGEAIEAMLNTRTSPLPKLKKIAKQTGSESKKPALKKKAAAAQTAASRKPRVCLDLDGVLAKYEGWRGADQIGPPLPGALEFARSLAKMAEIVIFSSRCSNDNGGETSNTNLSPAQLRIHVIEWLEKHKFPFSDVYTGQGKPKASAFIDDRGVSCRPQLDQDAFGSALEETRKLLRPGRASKLAATPAKTKKRKAANIG